jgi:anti-sigma-K factor RskA
MNLQTAEDRSAAAGEYVLGSLPLDERAAFEAALATDAPLRAEVGYWQDRLLALSRQAEPVAPSARLWPRIEAGLTPPVPTRRVVATLPWWQRLGLWQGVSGLALAASVALTSVLVLREQTLPAPQTQYVAVLQAPQGGPNGWVVEVRVDAASGLGRLRLLPVAPGQPVPAGRALQFWTKAPGAAGPSSLGLVAAGSSVELPVARLPDLRPEQLFEITLEPEGGSPIGRPTGPILFVGRAVRLTS